MLVDFYFSKKVGSSQSSDYDYPPFKKVHGTSQFGFEGKDKIEGRDQSRSRSRSRRDVIVQQAAVAKGSSSNRQQ